MKKWILILVLILILFVNPSKINIFNNVFTLDNKINKIKDIELNSEAKYIKYGDNIVLYNNEKIEILNENGNSKGTVKINKSIEDYNIYSNKYIDIWDKKNNTVLSIDEKAKTIFRFNTYPKTILYKSIANNRFITVYKKDDKEYVNIQDIEEEVVKEIEYSSKITHVDSIEENILVIDINTKSKLGSQIKLYDKNGNEKVSKEFEDIILDVICENKNIYLLFQDRIVALDTQLNKKYDTEIKDIKDVVKGKKGQVYLINGSGNIIILRDSDCKKITIKSDIIGIESLGESFITYSQHNIYKKDNKKITEFEEKIKDIVSIGEEILIVHFDNTLRFVKVH